MACNYLLHISWRARTARSLIWLSVHYLWLARCLECWKLMQKVRTPAQLNAFSSRVHTQVREGERLETLKECEGWSEWLLECCLKGEGRQVDKIILCSCCGRAKCNRAWEEIKKRAKRRKKGKNEKRQQLQSNNPTRSAITESREWSR